MPRLHADEVRQLGPVGRGKRRTWVINAPLSARFPRPYRAANISGRQSRSVHIMPSSESESGKHVPDSFLSSPILSRATFRAHQGHMLTRRGMAGVLLTLCLMHSSQSVAHKPQAHAAQSTPLHNFQGVNLLDKNAPRPFQTLFSGSSILSLPLSLGALGRMERRSSFTSSVET